MKFTVILLEDTTSSYSKAVTCLAEESYDCLFLGYPTSAESSFQSICRGSPWRDEIARLKEAGLFLDPEDMQMIRSASPLFDHLQGSRRRVFCYRDAFHFDLLRRLAGDMFALTGSSKIFGVKASKWLSLMEDVVLTEMDCTERDGKYVLSKAEETNAVFGEEGIASYLRERGCEVEMKTIDLPVKPLDLLKKMVSEALKQGKEVPARQVEDIVRLHLGFVDLILRHQSYEEAYEQWKNKFYAQSLQILSAEGGA
jgi:hypothetical protein